VVTLPFNNPQYIKVFLEELSASMSQIHVILMGFAPFHAAKYETVPKEGFEMTARFKIVNYYLLQCDFLVFLWCLAFLSLLLSPLEEIQLRKVKVASLELREKGYEWWATQENEIIQTAEVTHKVEQTVLGAIDDIDVQVSVDADASNLIVGGPIILVTQAQLVNHESEEHVWLVDWSDLVELRSPHIRLLEHCLHPVGLVFVNVLIEKHRFFHGNILPFKFFVFQSFLIVVKKQLRVL
jgi:hypothetical protein